MLALNLKKIDFTSFSNLLKKHENGDTELSEYVDQKGKYVEDMKNKNQVEKSDFEEKDSVKNLYSFLLHSSVRESTKKADENALLNMYYLLRETVVENNIQALEIYNHYADKHGIITWPIPQRMLDKEKARLQRGEPFNLDEKLVIPESIKEYNKDDKEEVVDSLIQKKVEDEER